MKTLKITTENVLKEIDIDLNNFESVIAELGGYMEIVQTERIAETFKDFGMVMICDEEGLIKQLPINVVASWLYGADKHGHPIVGDVIFAKRDGEDLKGFSDIEILCIRVTLRLMFPVKDEVKDEQAKVNANT